MRPAEKSEALENKQPAQDVKETEVSVNIEPEDVNIPAPHPPITDHEQLMQAAGIAQSDWQAVEYIIAHESSWRPDVYNAEGCVGLGQRCPASTLLAECPTLDPVCQLRHFTNYAVSRYGGWQGAYSFWQNQRWW